MTEIEKLKELEAQALAQVREGLRRIAELDAEILRLERGIDFLQRLEKSGLYVPASRLDEALELYNEKLNALEDQ